MTSTAFDALPGDVQFEMVTNTGVMVASRENDHFLMTLYRIFNFHVEIKKARATGEIHFTTIDHDILLVPYLDEINLSELRP